MNDSTIRFAHVIGQAFSIEKMDEDSLHFNQISSKEMMSWFEGGQLRKNQAQGNVKTIFYMMDDADSTLIALNYLETDTMRMFLTPQRKMEKVSAVKHEGTMYPISQIPPDKYRLPNFAWFDYVRPKSKDDILVWIPKAGGSELKIERRREAPLQNLGKKLAEKVLGEGTKPEGLKSLGEGKLGEGKLGNGVLGEGKLGEGVLGEGKLGEGKLGEGLKGLEQNIGEQKGEEQNPDAMSSVASNSDAPKPVVQKNDLKEGGQ